MNNKDLLITQGNYIPYLVIAYSGKESKKDYIYAHIYEYIHTHIYIVQIDIFIYLNYFVVHPKQRHQQHKALHFF